MPFNKLYQFRFIFEHAAVLNKTQIDVKIGLQRGCP